MRNWCRDAPLLEVEEGTKVIFNDQLPFGPIVRRTVRQSWLIGGRVIDSGGTRLFIYDMESGKMNGPGHFFGKSRWAGDDSR